MSTDVKKKTSDSGAKKDSDGEKRKFMAANITGELWAGKTEIRIRNRSEESRFHQLCGARRFCWNRMLGWWNDQYDAFKKERAKAEKAGKKPPKFKYPSVPKLVSVFINEIAKKDAPWWFAERIPRRIAEHTAIDLKAAFTHAFRRLREGKRGKKAGFPKYKGRKAPKSFTIRGSIHVCEGQIKLPNINFWIALKQKDFLPQDGFFPNAPKDLTKADPKLIRYMKATVSKRAGRWFVALLCEVDKTNPTASDGARLGVELGVRKHAYCSDGRVFENPEPLKRLLKRMNRLNRIMKRRFVKGAKQQSNRYYKAKDAYARIHYRIACLRRDAAHKTTTAILGVHETDPENRPKEIVLRGSSYIGMLDRELATDKKLRNRLARRVVDSAMGQLRRMLIYKAEREGINVVITDEFFESTQICSSCGYVLQGSERLTFQSVFRCPKCGYSADRDENSSYNLRDY